MLFWHPANCSLLWVCRLLILCQQLPFSMSSSFPLCILLYPRLRKQPHPFLALFYQAKQVDLCQSFVLWSPLHLPDYAYIPSQHQFLNFRYIFPAFLANMLSDLCFTERTSYVDRNTSLPKSQGIHHLILLGRPITFSIVLIRWLIT